MNAPLIWIVFPLVAALLFLLIRNRRVLVIYLGSFLCLTLTFLALVIPIGEVMSFGNLTVQIQPSLTILGRQLVIEPADSTILVLAYGMACFWFFGALVSRPRSIFISVGLAMIAILVAAIAVDPFLYSALLIEVAILISVPLLVQPGIASGSGTQRYLVFQTLGMPFILLAGWALGGSGANLGDPNLVLSATFLLGLGFAFLLAVFPFYSWIPLVADEAQPYTGGFIFSTLPVMILIILLDFINGLVIIRESDLFFQALGFCGVLMVATGGIWAAFQKNLARLVGYAVIMETGFFLIAIGIRSEDGLSYFSLAIIPRLIALGLIALGLTHVKRAVGGLDEENLNSLFRRMPFSAGAIIAAFFSLAGLPLLAEFSLKFNLLSMVSINSKSSLPWIFIGMLGLFIAIFRFLAVFIGSPGNETPIAESRFAKILMVTGVVVLFLIGLFPSFFLSVQLQLLQAFPTF
jgi:NADH-quinone oxidoreductase subunit N